MAVIEHQFTVLHHSYQSGYNITNISLQVLETTTCFFINKDIHRLISSNQQLIKELAQLMVMLAC